MDEGRVRCTSASAGGLVYHSDSRQSGSNTPIQAARVCLDCGYIELYLKTKELDELKLKLS